MCTPHFFPLEIPGASGRSKNMRVGGAADGKPILALALFMNRFYVSETDTRCVELGI
jgi:hypothetical protein